MTEEALKRANEIQTMIGQLHCVCFDEFGNGSIKLYTKDPIGIYFNKELSVEILDFFHGLENKYKKELEEL